MSNQTGAPADPCAEALSQVAQDIAVFTGQEREADLEAQEQAAKKADAAALLTLLGQIDAATTAWDAAKDSLSAAVTTLWAELSPCIPTLDAALGADKDCMQKAYDGYGERLAELNADLKQKQDAAAAASAAASTAAADLAAAQALFSQQYAQFAAYMGTLRDNLQTAGQKFKAAMGSHPCDARSAYILLREAQDIFKEFKDQAAKCLPEQMRELIMKINDLQSSNRQAQTAQLAAADEVQQAQDAVGAAADKTTVVLALFDECASAKAPPPQAPPPQTTPPQTTPPQTTPPQAGSPAGQPGS